ncbi:MAG: hypothetical protein HY043_10560, partial [Verrucomicrobia bacterium]|nr:hypothetical protein [Verrucomicrobiota bacterium]
IPRTADDVDPGADGIVNTLDDLLFLPIAGVQVYLLGRETEVITTGPNGRFHFGSVPVGDVKVVVDGRTASNPPAGMYFPEMVMDANMIAGVDNYTMLGMPVIYLPRLSQTILQIVDVKTNTVIATKAEGAAGLTDAQRQQLTIDVPANSLIAADGSKLTSGQVGISTVPPELVRDMLPPGVLQHTFDVTVQAPGIATFSTPAPMTFPNVFNAAPGTQLNFLSFDHTTGRLVIEGTATVSVDGLSVRTDPGTGVTHPGWHGLTPPGGPAGPSNGPPAVCEIDLGTDGSSLASVAAGRTLQPSSLAGSPTFNVPKALPLIVGETGGLSDPGLTWAAPAAGGDVCGLKVQIEVDGPLGKFMKKTGNLLLTNQTFTLRPFTLGTKPPKLKVLSGVAKTYDEVFGQGKFTNFITDELFGARIKVTASLLKSTGPPDVTVDTYYLYRWVNVNYPDGFLGGTSAAEVNARAVANATAAFRKTLNDGIGGWSTIKRVVASLPTNSPTHFSLTPRPLSPKIFDVSSPLANHLFQWEFDPYDKGSFSQEMSIQVDDGYDTVVGKLTLLGNGVNPARINLNLEGYKAELKRVILSLRNVTARPPYPPPAGFIFPIYEFSASAPGLPPVVAKRSVNGPGGTSFFEDNLNYVPGGATNYLDGLDKTLGTTDDVYYKRWVRVRDVFEQLFQGFMPENRHLIGPDGIAGSPDDDFDILQLLTLDGLVDAEAGKLAGLVAQQFQRVNFLNSAIQFTNVGATINCEWTDCFVTLGDGRGYGSASPGNPVFGLGGGGRDMATLGRLLPDPKLPFGAKFWALAEGLNVNATNQISVSVAMNLNYSGPDSFAADIANTISHEIGHTFGLVDAYTDDRKIGTALCRPSDFNCTPFDIMQAGASTDPYLQFAPSNIGLLKAAVGVSSAASPPFAKYEVPLLGELRQYRKTFNLATSSTGIRENNPVDPPPTEPEISVFQEDNSFFGEADEAVEIVGEIAADGPGGDFLDVPFTILNSGYGPLTVSSFAFVAGTKGFTLLNASTILGQPITPGHLTNLIVRFDPSVGGTVSDTLQIASDAATVPLLSIPITATAFASGPTALVELVGNNNFGGAIPGTAAITLPEIFRVSNEGQMLLQITGISFVQGAAAFTLTGLPANLASQPIQLTHGQSFTFGGRFQPDQTGLRRALIEIKTNDPQTPVARVSFVGTGLGVPMEAQWGDDFVAIESPDFPGTPPLRVKSDDKGNFEFFLPSQQFYHLTIFDPVTGLVGHETDATERSGQRTLLVDTMVFQGSTEPDSDYDGLPDDIEFAIGTNPNKVDTDGDGIDDFTAVIQGVDPLGGRGLPIGIVGQVPLVGNAKDVVVAARAGESSTLFAFVAAGSGGLAIVDVSKPTQPVLLNQMPLAGDATDLAVNLELGLVAVAANAGGLHLIDVSNPTAPRLFLTLPDQAKFVEIKGSVAYALVSQAVIAIQLPGGQTLQTLALPGAVSPTDFKREGTMLYFMQGSQLRVIDIGGNPMKLRGAFSVSAPSGQIFVGNGIAYVPIIPSFKGGYATVDVSHPDNLALISDTDVPFGVQSPNVGLVANGSGLGFLIGIVGPPDLDLLDVMDLSDPTNTFVFLTRINLPAAPNRAASAAGLAYVADGSSGLLVVNYLSFGGQSQLPTVSLALNVADADPARPGLQVVEGTVVPLQAQVQSAAPIHHVELVANGRVVQTSVSFPFNLDEVVAPSSLGNGGKLTIQVRAVDTGGNVGASAPLTIDILPDSRQFTLPAIDPPDGEIRPTDFGVIDVTFSKSISLGAANAAVFFVLDSRGQRIQPKAVRLVQNGQLVRMILDELAPGEYTLHIRLASVTDLSGHALGPADLISRFTTKKFTIQWANRSVPPGLTLAWFDPANWLPARVPVESDSVYINVPGKEISIVASLPTPNPDAYLTNRIGLQSLVCHEPLRLFYIDLHVAELLQMNNAFTFAGSKLTRTRLRGGSNCVLQVEGKWGRGLEGDSLLDNVTLEGNIALNFTQPEVAKYDGQFRITNGLTVNGSVSSAGQPKVSQGRSALEFYLDSSTIRGTGTFQNVNLYVGTEDVPANAQSGLPQNLTMTISSNITVRGGLTIFLLGTGTRLINHGKLIAEETQPPDNTRGGSYIGISTKGMFINEGSLEVQAGDRMTLTGALGNAGPLINRGTLRVGASSALFINVPLVSPRTICDVGGICELAGWSLTTDAGNTSELAGAGTWMVNGFEFRGGTVKMTEGAVLEGAAAFNDVTFEGELHNYNWYSSRKQNFPGYLLGYGIQISVITNLTLKGRIVFDRQANDVLPGVLLFPAGAQRLGGRGRIEFAGAVEGADQIKNSIDQLRVGVSPIFPNWVQLTIEPDITIRCRNLDWGVDNLTSDRSPPFIENQGTLLVNQLGDALHIGTLGFTNSGTIQIGASNVVTVSGRFAQTAFTQTPSGKLSFDAVGTTPGTTHGQVQVQGATAILDGTLSLSFVPPFQPKAGDTFELLTYKSHTGTFSTIVTPPPPAGLTWTTDYGATNFVLQLR